MASTLLATSVLPLFGSINILRSTRWSLLNRVILHCSAPERWKGYPWWLIRKVRNWLLPAQSRPRKLLRGRAGSPPRRVRPAANRELGAGSCVKAKRPRGLGRERGAVG